MIVTVILGLLVMWMVLWLFLKGELSFPLKGARWAYTAPINLVVLLLIIFCFGALFGSAAELHQYIFPGKN